jgi:hypothetical protein
MAPVLVTFEQAKSHLQYTADQTDADTAIQATVQAATAIILDYLKGRAHESALTVPVATSSVANPTVITTSAPHGLANTNSVFLADHVGSVPRIAGTYTVSNVAASSFTIPVAVTTAGTGGTVSPVWTVDTVPGQVHAAILLLLTHLMEHRGDDMGTDALTWEAIGRLLVRARDPALA